MTDPIQNAQDSEIGRFLRQIESLVENTHTLQRVAVQATQALQQQGFQIKVDVNQLTTEIEQGLRQTRQGSYSLSQQLEQYAELARISALITSSLELDQVLEDVMDTVIELTGAERAYLMLKNRDSDEMVVRSARNWDRETLEKEDITFSRSIINTAMEQGKPILTTNAQDDARFQNFASVAMNALRSIVVIPLMIQGRAIGVLYADNRLHQTFSQSSVPLLSAFASQASVAIENARLFEKVKDDLNEARREVQRLRIQIDRGKVNEQLDRITETDYFQRLSTMARDMRRRTQEIQGDDLPPDEDESTE
ncbi:MAG: GAF domain-containing protein [Anaerolineae bacterium]|nr:GAF domain-containing protein [Anaerolineae bacterium]